jgi:transposase
MRRDFERAYAKVGRPSIPPKMLLKALLLQALYSIRSERQLVEQIQMTLLYKWFLDLSLDAPSWNATAFTKNRERFEKHGLLRKFFEPVVAQAYVVEWATDDQFTVDGTLIATDEDHDCISTAFFSDLLEGGLDAVATIACR